MAGAARVFISYSSKDAALVTRLKDDLARAGVDVWLDHEKLTPGTLNWQAAVLKGIEQATDVIYAASPDAASSKYVAHELAIAEGEGKRILPFWIRGDKWYFCTPMGFYLAQYTDGRDAAYAVGLAELLVALGAVPTTQPAAPTPTREATQPAPQSAPMSGQAAPAPTLGLIRLDGPFTTYQERVAAAYQQRSAAADSQRSNPLPDIPARLASLGFRGVNPGGTPAILPPLVSVTAGPFLMGSVNSDTQAWDDEKPQHRVELAAFQIGKYPVTVAEYALALHAGAVREPPALGSVTWQTQLQHPDHPVVCVSWQDASAYVAWLRGVTGEAGWRLPSEAQWEKAARWDVAHGVSRIYPWGDTFDKARCNTNRSGIGTTEPVGSHPASDAQRSGASPWGAEDLAGNVWGWTSSLYKPYPYAESDGREDLYSIGSRTLRGGSWGSGIVDVRAAYRNNGGVDGLNSSTGIRLARAALV